MMRMTKKSPSDSSPRAIAFEATCTHNDNGEMKNQENSSSSTIPGAAGAGKKERAFELSLPALVTGMDVLENKFKEKTQILSISSEEATILLRSRVTVGSKLDLSLEIPKTLILESHLKLQISGTVILTQTEPAQGGKKRLVSIRLDKRFRLNSLPPSVN
jgi:hypothetical protein